ncbi:unnamed protein product [Ostreobium quekettii]|uniref:Uncharacterized protein n=1 Tax=Ostreobium quekettii TaxID=121088 RepID=A0A8S1J9D4_9CHLO|nr:unnamed protein product [Ostreobium quekettii]
MATLLRLPGLAPLNRRLALPCRAPLAHRVCMISSRFGNVDDAKTSIDGAEPSNDAMRSALLSASALLAPAVLGVDEALAKNGEYGLLEGKIASLIHPAVMLVLFCSTFYAGWLGWQWRRTREIGNEIKELKKELPAVGADGVRPASPLNAQIAEMEQIRKELVAGGFRDRHFNQGAILLAGGVSIAFYGGMNTFLRAEKLFPGPHLYAGAIIVVLWALAASLVPAMQKGNEAARIGHIVLNAASTLMFISQVPTGLEILGKVWEQTSFP